MKEVGSPLLLADARVDSNGGKIALAKQFVELGGTEGGLHEDDDLVELQGIEEFVQLSVLLGFAQLDVELLQTVEGELCLVVDVDLQRVLHELLAYGSDLLGECRAEHHDLLLGRSGAEDILDVAAHIWFFCLS